MVLERGCRRLELIHPGGRYMAVTWPLHGRYVTPRAHPPWRRSRGKGQKRGREKVSCGAGRKVARVVVARGGRAAVSPRGDGGFIWGGFIWGGFV